LNQRLRNAGFKALLALLWLGCFLLLADVQLGGDGMSYYAYVRSAIVDGDLNFYNEDGNYNHFISMKLKLTSY